MIAIGYTSIFIVSDPFCLLIDYLMHKEKCSYNLQNALVSIDVLKCIYEHFFIEINESL